MFKYFRCLYFFDIYYQIPKHKHMKIEYIEIISFYSQNVFNYNVTFSSQKVGHIFAHYKFEKNGHI